MLFIGITGGVGAGKSEILNYLRTSYNSKVMLTDEIAHDVMEPGTDCYNRLKEIFATEKLAKDPAMSPLFAEDAGFSVYNEDGTFHRPNLAKVIFSDDKMREALNAIVHPAVKQYVIDQYEIEKDASAANDINKAPLDLLVVESALLIDDNYGAICEEMWYIYTTEENRRARLKASRGYSDEKIQNIFDSQLSETAFRAACQEVIDNNQTPEEAFAQIKEILSAKGIRQLCN
ncbi:MAG: dephospho-CoA kinase [Eubacterium sp.]|nr:dephospho-CoA kinase [Eubacterium sp.]